MSIELMLEKAGNARSKAVGTIDKAIEAHNGEDHGGAQIQGQLATFHMLDALYWLLWTQGQILARIADRS